MTKADRVVISKLRKQIKSLQRQVKRNSAWGRHKYTGFSNDIRIMRAKGLSDRKIAHIIGCSKSTANRMRHDYGLHATLYDRRWR